MDVPLLIQKAGTLQWVSSDQQTIEISADQPNHLAIRAWDVHGKPIEPFSLSVQGRPVDLDRSIDVQAQVEEIVSSMVEKKMQSWAPPLESTKEAKRNVEDQDPLPTITQSTASPESFHIECERVHNAICAVYAFQVPSLYHPFPSIEWQTQGEITTSGAITNTTPLHVTSKCVQLRFPQPVCVQECRLQGVDPRSEWCWYAWVSFMEHPAEFASFSQYQQDPRKDKGRWLPIGSASPLQSVMDLHTNWTYSPLYQLLHVRGPMCTFTIAHDSFKMHSKNTRSKLI